MPSLCLISLGCNKNLVDSEVMLGKLKDYKLVHEPHNADVTIINTCGFIESAKQESVRTILQAARSKGAQSKLVVSGCLSERYAKELQDEIPEIDMIIGVRDYDKIDLLLQQNSDVVIRSTSTDDVFLIDKEERVITGSSLHAYIKISEGCNQKCSFCAIPSFKGKLRSRSIESCVREVESLIKNRFRDFSFLAQDSSSYMRDLGKKDALIDLINAIENIDGLRSARILYLYPSTTSMRLIERIADSAVFQPYFDMPLQHISNSMLKLMRRGAPKNHQIELLKAMRGVKNSFIRTTFLLGHPGESEADFDELCEFVSDFVFDRVNVFAFSSQESTKAHTMPFKVSAQTTTNRINALDKILQAQQRKIYKNYENSVIEAIIDGVSEQSDLLFSARDVRWDRDIDGEILINENLTNSPLSAGYYKIAIDKYMESGNQRYLFGKALEKL